MQDPACFCQFFSSSIDLHWPCVQISLPHVQQVWKNNSEWSSMQKKEKLVFLPFHDNSWPYKTWVSNIFLPFCKMINEKTHLICLYSINSIVSNALLFYELSAGKANFETEGKNPYPIHRKRCFVNKYRLHSGQIGWQDPFGHSLILKLFWIFWMLFDIDRSFIRVRAILEQDLHAQTGQ